MMYIPINDQNFLNSQLRLSCIKKKFKQEKKESTFLYLHTTKHNKTNQLLICLKLGPHSFIQKKTRRDSHIVVQTKSHCFIVFSMMSWRPNDSKSRIQLSFRNSLRDLFNKIINGLHLKIIIETNILFPSSVYFNRKCLISRKLLIFPENIFLCVIVTLKNEPETFLVWNL